MSDPTGVVVRTNPDVLPGVMLSEPAWLEHFDVEEELNRRLAARTIDVAMRTGQLDFDAAEARANALISKRPFAALGEDYMRAVLTDRSLMPYLLLACLVRKHPSATLQTARELLRDNGRFWPTREAVLDLFGFRPKNAVAGDSNTPAKNLTGERGGEPSAPQE